jgi:hypothetical protein
MGDKKEEKDMTEAIRKKEREDIRKAKVMASFKKMAKKYAKTLKKLSKN